MNDRGENTFPVSASHVDVKQLQARFQEGLAFHKKGQLAQAQAIYEQILKLRPRHALLLHLLGVIALQTSNPGRAVELIGKVLEIDPDNAPAYSDRGNALRDLEQPQAALESYDRAIALKPDFADAFNNRGNALRDLGQPQAALESYDRAIALKPDFAEAFNNHGNALRDLRQPQAALESYDRAIALKPDFAEAFNNRGNTLRSLGRLEEAADALQKAIALRPDFPEFWTNLAWVLTRRHRWAEVEGACRNAITLRPAFPEAWSRLGMALIELRRPEEGADACRKAIDLRPDFADGWANLGHAMIVLNRWVEAEDACRKAVTLKSDLPVFWDDLARALLGQNRKAEAIVAVHTANALQPREDRALRRRNSTCLQQALDRTIYAAISGGPQFALSEDYIRSLHSIAMDGLEKSCGEYRTASVWISGSVRQPPYWEEVPLLMRSLCQYINENWEKHDAIHLCAFVLWCILWIHPFFDGNGRVARAVSHVVFCIKRGEIIAKEIIMEPIEEGHDLYLANIVHAQRMFLETQNIEAALQPIKAWLSRHSPDEPLERCEPFCRDPVKPRAADTVFSGAPAVPDAQNNL